ncbi:hypothetical protein V8E54_006263 [Elaphomyces granulatus]
MSESMKGAKKIKASETIESPAQLPSDSYAKAHEFVTRFNNWRSGDLTLQNPEIYEKNFSIQLSANEWANLRDNLGLSENNDQYPRYAFNSATNTLIINCMPTAVHESVQFCFTSALSVAESSLPFLARCREEMKGFSGEYAGSSKVADLAIQINNADDELENKMDFEIGFSQDYEDLSNICVVVGFEEEPKYECPVDIDMDEEEFGGIGFPDPAELTPKDIRLSGPFGPAVFGKSPYGGVNGEVDKKVDDEEVDAEPDEEHDIVWVGRISKDLLTSHTVTFKRSQFLSTTPDNDRTIQINCEDFRHILALKIKALAVFRCQTILKEWEKRHGGHSA